MNKKNPNNFQNGQLFYNTHGKLSTEPKTNGIYFRKICLLKRETFFLSINFMLTSKKRLEREKENPCLPKMETNKSFTFQP